MLIFEHLNYFSIIFLTPDTLKSHDKMGVILWITTPPPGRNGGPPEIPHAHHGPQRAGQMTRHRTPVRLHQETHPMHFPGLPSSTTSKLWMNTS